MDKRSWSLALTAFVNINEPSDPMKDHDWLSIPDWNIRDEKFSYTESDVEAKYRLFSAEITTRFYRDSLLEVSALAGYAYHRVSQYVIGYSGWYLAEFPDVREPDSGTGTVGYYRITYHLPQIGLMTRLHSVRPGFSIGLKTAFVFVAASDYDDHLLRNKEAEGSLTGSGVAVRLDGRWMFGSENRGIRPFVDIFVDFLSIHADGKQDQTWYDNEWSFNPETGEEEIVTPAGTEYKGLDYEVNSTQHGWGIALGISF